MAAQRLVVMPCTGAVYDYDKMPNNHKSHGRPGKWCPDSGMPCDSVALANVDLSLVHTPEAKADYLKACSDHVDAVQSQLQPA